MAARSAAGAVMAQGARVARFDAAVVYVLLVFANDVYVCVTSHGQRRCTLDVRRDAPGSAVFGTYGLPMAGTAINGARYPPLRKSGGRTVTGGVVASPVVKAVASHIVHTGRIGISVSRAYPGQGKKVDDEVLVVGTAYRRVDTIHDPVTIVAIRVHRICIGVGRMAAPYTCSPTRHRP